MPAQQGEGDPRQAEACAGRMNRSTGTVPDVERFGEVIAVAVDAHAGCRLLAIIDRDKKLCLQVLLLLAALHDRSRAAKERVVGGGDLERKLKSLKDVSAPADPALPKRQDLFR